MCSICGGTASADFREIAARLQEKGINGLLF